MSRPKLIRIGPFEYRVRWPRYVLDLDRHGEETVDLPYLSARVDHPSLTIWVSRSMDRAVQRKSLLHEVVHACNWITGHEDADTEEQWVRSMAFPLLGVLRDNPELVAFLTGPDDHRPRPTP